MDCVDIMKEFIKHLEDLELLTTDAQLYKADEIWDRLLVLIMELKQHNCNFKVIVPRLQSIGLQDIITDYLEYNRPSLQVKVMEFTKVFAIVVYYDHEFKAIKTCTEFYSYKRWSEECKFDIKPMVEIIVHESDQEMLTLAINLFLKVCSYIDDENFGIVLSRLVSRLESSSGSVAVGFIKNLQTMYRNICHHDPVKAAGCGVISAIVNTLRSVDQAVVDQSIEIIHNFSSYVNCEVTSAELIRSGLIQTLSDLYIRYSDDLELRTRIIKVAGTAASDMRDFPVSLVRSLVFEQLTISILDVDMYDCLRRFGHINDMIQKSTNKAEMIKAFREYGIMQQLITIYSRTDVNLYDYGDETSIVKLVKTLADFADNHPDSSIRTELDQGRIFENLMAIVKSDTAEYTNRKIAGQIIETCFQHRVHVANSSIQPYNDNAKIGTSSGIAGYVRGEVRTLVEMRYIQYLQCILCKPMWWIDITNQHIVEQWRADSLDRNILPSTFNLALEQLGVFVKQLVCSGSDGLGTIVPGPVELTYILDNGIPDNVYTRLVTNVSDIEHGSNHNTGQMVHNLIDASMYSVVYGQTMIAPLSIRLKYTTMVPCDILLSTRLVSDTPIINGNPKFISRKFQCLPSEFRVEQDGSVTINSYINNLNPIWHRDMYKCIAKIFKCFVPMFESLFRTMDPMFKYIDIHNGTKGYELPNQSDYGDMQPNTQVTRPVYVPILPEHFKSKYESAKPVSLRGRNLQVIVKLTNIQLTPSKPKYDEGNWHIEGPRNESIAAIGLYYYDVENITTPKLDFREAVNSSYYEMPACVYWKDVYDIVERKSSKNQYIGSLELPNGRCVVYPNRYQHKEQSFELADPTQPGHCKILTFFVVDSVCRIVSTAHVAPQQPQWYNSSLDKAHVPPELWNDIMQYIQGVQSPAEAKHHRDELTSDRIQITAAYNTYRYEQKYNLGLW
ncbi:hypothetical protein BATDEDRAFT_36048 [Batrachochytrium dendrobatidis JAM81]|uniref:DUF4246 domain-containing protein n=1 Tax=Batrachochytrium dendrobatidis (strain JAM81 / FGSC 10211) TaxID=684364 RepID=F4PBQ4_BATDJ|nr:uncharacterized protein BATDEDRAFT_36048 [Batrachochytrium dendrobatidis JAM81]EGF77483.1 hypothetical protein BATDEDRAFT_36048 [Batrachochytrium dendrobatidis JAM81]|eukprot:XP_006681998.1 hypothetical protein BATDEDRAFT_36048 [Batrachochytrium dendrobatidis JAM81]